MRLRACLLPATLVLGILVAPLVSQGQQAAGVPRIAFLRPGAPPPLLLEAFRQGLRELGYVDGVNIAIEYAFQEGRLDRLPEIAVELVRRKVDLILTASTPAALAAKNATRTIPIVFMEVGDPVGVGVVTSLARPGGNLTGVSNLAPDLSGKRLQLLKEVVPKVARVAVLRNPENPTTTPKLRETQLASRALGVQLLVLDVRNRGDLEKTVRATLRERADAVIVLTDTVTLDHRSQVVELVAKARLPAIYEVRDFVDAGGLMAYGTNFAERFRRAAIYVDKILKGAKPADLPVEQPMRFDMAINLKTAKALGLTMPQSILIQATDVIQ